MQDPAIEGDFVYVVTHLEFTEDPGLSEGRRYGVVGVYEDSAEALFYANAHNKYTRVHKVPFYRR